MQMLCGWMFDQYQSVMEEENRWQLLVKWCLPLKIPTHKKKCLVKLGYNEQLGTSQIC
jgi:hypothetical protein